MKLLLFGCKGYSYNYFVDKVGLPRNYVKRLKEHNTGKIEGLQFSKLTQPLEKNKYYLCKIMNKLSNPLITFVIYNDNIFVSWSKKPCQSKQQWRTLNCTKRKKECRDMNIKKIHVTNIYSKINKLIKDPTLQTLTELFGYDKSYLQPQNDLDDIINRFKHANVYVYYET